MQALERHERCMGLSEQQDESEQQLFSNTARQTSPVFYNIFNGPQLFIFLTGTLPDILKEN